MADYIADGVKKIFARYAYGSDRDALKVMEADSFEKLGLGLLELVGVRVELEEEFGLGEDDLESTFEDGGWSTTVGQVIAIVRARAMRTPRAVNSNESPPRKRHALPSRTLPGCRPHKRLTRYAGVRPSFVPVTRA